jgi:hypothetical protein
VGAREEPDRQLLCRSHGYPGDRSEHPRRAITKGTVEGFHQDVAQIGQLGGWRGSLRYNRAPGSVVATPNFVQPSSSASMRVFLFMTHNH